MKTKYRYLIMAVTQQGKKVLDIFATQNAARKVLNSYKNIEFSSVYIKQVSPR